MYKKTTILFGSLVVFFVIFSSCSKSNHPPSKPTNPYPADGAENITNTGLTLAWDADDPDNDILHYKIYMGKSAPFPLLGETDNESYTIRDSLDRGTTYYWKVVVFDEKGDSAIGDIWSFTTQENHPPNSPTNPSPTNGATGISIQNITLSWSCSDPDGDALRYDVYFGTSTNPPRTAQDITSSSYTVNNLNYSTTYYWKIVAKDNETSTSGPIWSFTTQSQPNSPPNTPDSVYTVWNWYYPYGYYDWDTVRIKGVAPEDPDGDLMYLRFDLGNGDTSSWIGPYESGDSVYYNYLYSNPSSDTGQWYQIRMQARDINNNLSEWSPPRTIAVGRYEYFSVYDTFVNSSNPYNKSFSMTKFSEFNSINIVVTSGTSVNAYLYDPWWSEVCSATNTFDTTWDYVWTDGRNGFWEISVQKTSGSSYVDVFVHLHRWPSSLYGTKGIKFYKKEKMLKK